MDDWKIIWSSTPPEIYMARSYLEANGVQCMLRDELTAQTNYCANTVGGVKLLVKEEDGKRAAELLVEGGFVPVKDCDPGNEVAIVKISATTDKKRCPFCGSANIKHVKNTDAAMAILSVLFQAFFSVLRRPYKCLGCGKTWKWERRHD